MPGDTLAWELVKAQGPEKIDRLVRLGKEPLPDEETRSQLIADLLQIASDADRISRHRALMILRVFRSRLGIIGDQGVFKRLEELFHRQYTRSHLAELAESLHRDHFDNESQWKRSLFRSMMWTLVGIHSEKGRELARNIAPIFAGTKLEITLRELDERS